MLFTSTARGEEASAEDKESARQLLVLGNKAFGAQEYAAALEHYQQADALMGVPTTALGVGRAQLALGQLVSARDTFLRIARYPRRPDESQPFRVARNEARRLAYTLAGRIPEVTFEVSPASAEVWLDGELVTKGRGRRSLDPGRQELIVRAPGHATARRVLVANEGGHYEVRLALREKRARKPVRRPKPAAATPSDPRPYESHAIASFAVGAAALALGTSTGIASLLIASDVNARCAGDVCPSDLEGDGDRATALAHVSTASFVVAGLGHAAGVVLWLAPWAEEEPKVEASFGPGSVMVRGSW